MTWGLCFTVHENPEHSWPSYGTISSYSEGGGSKACALDASNLSQRRVKSSFLPKGGTFNTADKPYKYSYSPCLQSSAPWHGTLCVCPVMGVLREEYGKNTLAKKFSQLSIKCSTQLRRYYTANFARKSKITKISQPGRLFIFQV